jgi:pyruvate formate lyase activating enzyme
MKGCPMKCLWCSSPQTQKPSLEILYIELSCKRCGRCVEVCPFHAIAISQQGGWKIDRELCTECGDCVDACPNQALELLGKWMTVEELFNEIGRESAFYRRSSGGVTVGGGEPTMQFEFVTEFLKRCRQSYIHTAIETCGYVASANWRKTLEYVDLVYIDVKHLDAVAHSTLTGVSNEIILGNVRIATAMRPTIIRVPTVPGYNDSESNIRDTAAFAAGLGKNLKRIELLPYHKFGTHTYSRLGREFRLPDVEPPDDDHMQRLREIAESFGVKTQIGSNS